MTTEMSTFFHEWIRQKIRDRFMFANFDYAKRNRDADFTTPGRYSETERLLREGLAEVKSLPGTNCTYFACWICGNEITVAAGHSDGQTRLQCDKCLTWLDVTEAQPE